jgi:hypothetical protein
MSLSCCLVGAHVGHHRPCHPGSVFAQRLHQVLLAQVLRRDAIAPEEKLRKWWTKERNAERKGAKSVQDGTADKQEERILCFLGFVQRYKCLPSDDMSLPLALVLNHLPPAVERKLRSAL